MWGRKEGSVWRRGVGKGGEFSAEEGCRVGERVSVEEPCGGGGV